MVLKMLPRIYGVVTQIRFVVFLINKLYTNAKLKTGTLLVR